MHKSLDVSQVLKTFTGEPFKDGEKEFTLQMALLQYINNAHLMGLTNIEEAIAYEIGIVIGKHQESVGLTQTQYDVLKKICDNGKITSGRDTTPVFSLPVSQQVKQMVDSAHSS